jgi:hypothetical protein
MNELYLLIVFVSLQIPGGVHELKLNVFYRPSVEQCEQELLVLEEHYTTQLGKQVIDRVHMYGTTWYKHKHMLSGPIVGFTIKCETIDKTIVPIDQPKIIPWIFHP